MTGGKTVSHIRKEILLHSNIDPTETEMWGKWYGCRKFKVRKKWSKGLKQQDPSGLVALRETLFHASVWNVLLRSCICRRRKHSRLAKYGFLNICVQLFIKEMFQKTAPRLISAFKSTAAVMSREENRVHPDRYDNLEQQVPLSAHAKYR